MFVLKLFRRRNGQLVCRTLEVTEIISMDCGNHEKLLEIEAYRGKAEHDTFFIGKDPYPEDESRPPTDIIDRYGSWNMSLWGWGLLENSDGKTTEHYRPHSYG